MKRRTAECSSSETFHVLRFTSHGSLAALLSSLSAPEQTHTPSTSSQSRTQASGALATAIAVPTPSSVNAQPFQGYTAVPHIDHRPSPEHARQQLTSHPAELYRSHSVLSLAIHRHRISCYALDTFGADLGARPPAVKSSPRSLSGDGAGLPSTARIQRRLVHLVYLVYLVGRTGNSSRRTRQTRKTSQPDRRTRARCASTEDHQAPSPPLLLEQGISTDIIPPFSWCARSPSSLP